MFRIFFSPPTGNCFTSEETYETYEEALDAASDAEINSPMVDCSVVPAEEEVDDHKEALAKRDAYRAAWWTERDHLDAIKTHLNRF